MSQEILFKCDDDAEGQVITVEDNEVPASREETDGRYSVTAYVKNEGGHTSMHSPTFLIQHTQRVPVAMRTKGKDARIFHATLFNDHAHVAIRVPPEGGTFDLVPGYWGLSISGTYRPPGGIFATASYN